MNVKRQAPKHTTGWMVRNYRCATCWGGLIAHGENVHCDNPDCDGKEFVTKEYVEKRRMADRVDYQEAMRNVGELLGFAKPKPRYEAEILNELGID